MGTINIFMSTRDELAMELVRRLYELAANDTYRRAPSYSPSYVMFQPCYPPAVTREFVPDPLLARKAKWCHELDSNQPHTDFQSAALPDELPRH